MKTVDKVLGANGESPPFFVIGNCDIIINGLTSGSVKLQYLLTETDELPVPAWTDYPEGTFSADIFKTIFISSTGVQCKFVGVSNNAGVYVRLSRFLNT